MSRHVIFFVHGVGDDAKGWSQDLRKGFQALFDAYPLPAGGRPFDEQFETVEVLYNDFFDGWRTRVAAEANAALQLFAAGGMPAPAVGRLLQAGAAAGGGGFLRTHALDVAQYRFLALIADAIRDTIQHAIMSRLVENDFGVPVRWSIIGHSLGTIAVHDTLHQMFKPGPGSEESGQFQPYAVLMLANVSQLLHDSEFLGAGVDAYRSVVRPNRDPDLGACRYFLSAANRLDPVSIAGAFSPPDGWLTPEAKLQRRFRPLEFRALPKSMNVHGYKEYLAHPAVHVPLFRILTGDPDWISDASENAAHAAYDAANPLPDPANAARAAIEALGQRAGLDDWFERVSMWKEVLDRFTSE